MRTRLPRAALLVLMLAPAPAAAAEWQIKPFAGAIFGGETTFLSDLESAAGRVKFMFGISGVLLGSMFGIEGDIGRTPGFFETGEQTSATLGLITESSVTTLTGNIVVALPRQWTEYTLRPYFVAGGGQMRVRAVDTVRIVVVESNLPAVDIGGGVTGFLTTHVGLSWDVRYFQSLGGTDQGIGISLGPEELSFWRASMALAIRY
jgi:hypothetical protein